MKKRTFTHKSRWFRRFLRANEAVSALEYALIVGVVAVGIGTAIFALRDNIVKEINDMATEVTGAGTKAVSPF